MKYLNFGSCNIDNVYSLDHIVRPGETIRSEKLTLFPGGKGLNQSIALARAGVEVYHAGCVGIDGDMLLDILRENGVDTTYLRRVNEKNGHAMIQVSKEGDNSIVIYAGSNAMISCEHIDDALAHFEKGDVLLLQNEINNLEYLIDSAYKKEMFIILNPSPINDTIFKLDLSKLSCLILNEGEMRDISGKTDIYEGIEYFERNFPKLRIMLTLGKDGCIYAFEKERVFHPIFEVNTVDTTAAGDTFTGYFAAELSSGSDIPTRLRLASCAAAISVSRHGAAPSIPTRPEVLETLKNMNPKQTDKSIDRIKAMICKYVQDNLTSASLGELSELLGYSEVYTGVLTKRIFAMTFTKLVQDRRLSFAADLLRTSELPISDIIKLSGYENESYFRGKFMEKYKQRPLEYRKKKEKS